ncbi:hypothetical protein [Lysobacter sp. CA196]|uniref:hypothetical protein n=1 Tax=Lysobacter sp. CA196 TaxID=3455606 RepID=UPI003F8D71E0
MAVKIADTDESVWLCDENSLQNAAAVAVVTVALSVLVSFLGAKMEIMPLSLLSKWLAVAAVASHLWFAILKTRYVGALYMFITWRWGSSASPEVRTVRTWARRIATGTVGAWAVAAMVAPLPLLMHVTQQFSTTIAVISIPILFSVAQSASSLSMHHRMRASLLRARSIPPSCLVRL